MDAEATSANGGRGDFFAVDRHAWAHVCGLGMNAAITYLVLASGTGGDNRTTSWSVNAVEKYTSVSRPRANDALQALSRGGLVRHKKTGKRPQYEIIAAIEVPNCKDAQAEAQWVWLPNAIVTGASNETPPIELIRQSGNLAALRLFVDLYAAQSLAADCGVDWRQLRRTSERTKVGEYGAYVIFGFEIGGLETFTTAPFVAPHLTGKREKVETNGTTIWRDAGMSSFWAALKVLTSTGLVEIVEHLIEGTGAEAEILHPYGINDGEELEQEVAAAAHQAGYALLNDWRRDVGDKYPDRWLVPVLAHIAGVELVGIFRTRYRPRTRSTAAWFVRKGEWAEWKRRYEDLGRKACGETDQQTVVAKAA